MPVPTRTPLGGSTLNRKWYLDVDTSVAQDGSTWTPVMGFTEFKPDQADTLQDDSDYDGGGYKSSTKTAEAWSCSGKVARKVTVADATAYDAGQEYLRLKAQEMGPANTSHVRWYEMTPDGPREEAYEGNAATSWSPDGGGMDGLDVVSLTLTGQGQRTAITHPDA